MHMISVLRCVLKPFFVEKRIYQKGTIIHIPLKPFSAATQHNIIYVFSSESLNLFLVLKILFLY